MPQTFGIRELAERAKKMGAIDVAQGVIDTDPPKALIQHLQELPAGQYSRYNNKRGVLEFREAIQQYLAHRQWNLSIDSIMATSGVTGAITSALLSHCTPGATVLITEPFFIGHKLLLEALGFSIRYFPLPLDQDPDWKALENMIMEDVVEAVILTTPANPTGHIVDIKTMERLSQAATSSACLLIIDEMYRDFIWDESPISDAQYNNLSLDSTVITRSFSKSLAIPGWRIGWAITDPERIETMAGRHDAIYLGGNTLGQHALARTLAQNQADIDTYILTLRKQLLQNKALFMEAFTAYGMKPLNSPATYYMIMEHNREDDMVAIEELLTKKIAATPLRILYADTTKPSPYIRAHFGVSPHNAHAVHEYLTKL